MNNFTYVRERIIRMTRRCLTDVLSPAWLILACCLSAPAWSMGIGEWRTLSYLGERALAEAEIFHEPEELIDAGCFHLLHLGAGADFPPLGDARLSVRNTPKGLRLRLESSHSMSEPVSQIRLKITCGALQTRDMVLLFSPREYAAATLPTSVPQISHNDQTPTADSGKKHPAVATTTSVAQRGAGKPAGSTSTQARNHGSRQVKPATRIKPDTRLSTQGDRPKLVLSSELDAEIVNRLRLSANLRQPPKEASTEEREKLRRLYRSMMQLADLKESQGIASPVTPAEASAPTTVSEAPEPAATAASPAPVTPIDEPKAVALPPLDQSSHWWLPLLGLLLLALLLGFWLKRGRKSHHGMPEPIEAMPPIHSVSMNMTSEQPAEAADTLESLLRKEAEATPPAETSGTSAFANVRGVTVHAENPSYLTSYRTMLDLADSMMAFGLNNDAADALKEYVEEHPGVAVEPWLKLLDILRQTGKRDEFNQYSTKLRQHFNLDLPDWDASPNLAGAADARGSDESADLETRFRTAPSPLEAFPHVRDRLVSAWGQPECVDFLQHLMRDNRDGKRRGFPLIVVDDILLLLDVTKELTGIDMDASISERPEIFSDTW